jgi:hypothetical protein
MNEDDLRMWCIDYLNLPIFVYRVREERTGEIQEKDNMRGNSDTFTAQYFLTAVCDVGSS